MKRYDVIIVGLGIMGAAAAWRAARAGASVLALEMGGPTHRDGSSHGASRIFRRAYWEGKIYLEMLSLADQGWRELESDCQSRVIVPTGGLFIGPKSTSVVAGSLHTAEAGSIDHEHLTSADVRARFPQFHVHGDMEAVFEPGAYAILAEEARLQMLNDAVRRGAILRYGERATSIRPAAGRSAVVTTSQTSIGGGAVLVCGGAGNAQLLPEIASITQANRVPIYWFAPQTGRESDFGPDRLPVFLYEMQDGALLYGIPSQISAESGVKVGFHNRQHVPIAQAEARTLSIGDYADQVAVAVSKVLPWLRPKPMEAKWCTYTMTPDESFVLAESSAIANVFYACACSGHGFKFAPAIGQVLAEKAMGLPPSVELGAFGLDRLRTDP